LIEPIAFVSPYPIISKRNKKENKPDRGSFRIRGKEESEVEDAPPSSKKGGWWEISMIPTPTDIKT